MDNDNNKGGFSGLSDLASDISGLDGLTAPEDSCDSAPSPKTSPRQSEIKKKGNDATASVEVQTFGNSKGGGSSRWKWILGMIAVATVIWFANNSGQKTSKSSYSPPKPSPTHSLSKGYTADFFSMASQNKNKESELRYEKPPVGKKNVLSVHQICWCIRERIRIETMRGLITAPEGLLEFNYIVDDYNRRCGHYRYRSGSLEQAQLDVNAKRQEIIDTAIKDAHRLGQNNQTAYRWPPSTKSSSNTAKNSSPNLVRVAQLLLTALGYEPGPIDGKYGQRTAKAVKAFQEDVGFPKNGRIDKDLIENLQKAVEYK